MKAHRAFNLSKLTLRVAFAREMLRESRSSRTFGAKFIFKPSKCEISYARSTQSASVAKLLSFTA
ncbi:hypothetical protein CJI57_06020 [Bifidobacteriaceae bacterium WP012]|nr:hypothetical protein CJI57_06020 [Bifidobacteriaceae bacterium WP012]